MQLVSSYEEALACAREFQRVPNLPDTVAFRQLGKFFHWFYFEEIHGFAPSKFIGYVGTTAEDYDSSGTGTDTNAALRKLFVRVPRPSQQFDSLAERLSLWLNETGASLSRKTTDLTGGIYVRSIAEPETLDSRPVRAGVEHFEGHPVEVRQTAYERNPKARADCLRLKGYSCQACEMNFEERYGEVGREFIHVHHVESLAAIGGRHKVDPQKDLLPLCPNCHAMIHRLPHPQTVDALVELLRRPRDDASET